MKFEILEKYKIRYDHLDTHTHTRTSARRLNNSAFDFMVSVRKMMTHIETMKKKCCKFAFIKQVKEERKLKI